MIGHIFIEREIGVETTPQTVRNNIAEYPKATEFEVHFNSIGGDVYDGYQIGIILRNLGKPTTAIIEGQCASIATYDACCCDKVVMSPHGDFMIHDPTGTIQGRAEDFLEGAQRLSRIKNEIIDRYMTKVSRKGITREQLSAMMDKETSMGASEAQAMGFVDEVREKLKAVAKLDLNKFKMENTITKQEVEGMFASLGSKIDKLFNKAFKPKNLDVPLADGTKVTSSAETPDQIEGSTVTDEQGNPLADGTYVTADGFEIEVTGGAGVVSAYTPAMDDKKNASDQIAALQKQVQDLTAQLGMKAKEAEDAVAAKAKTETEFKAVVEELKTEFKNLKAKTFGDQSAPDKATEFRDQQSQQRQFDPMAEELGQAWITSHNMAHLPQL